MSVAKYSLLPKELAKDSEDAQVSSHKGRRTERDLKQSCISLQILLGLSTCLNVALMISLFTVKFSHKGSLSPYAALVDSATVGNWTFRSKYYSHNRTQSDALWEAINYDVGIVALTDKETAEMGLPRSERFPWDRNKGLYLINGYHNLHCLKMLWKSLASWRDGQTFGLSDWHSFHCIDSLRQDTLCSADDTPRYTGGEQPGSATGMGQQRQCRDWSHLESWARTKTACYRHLNDSVEDTLDMYRFCPEGSPYNARIEKFYGASGGASLIEKYGDIAA